MTTVESIKREGKVDEAKLHQFVGQVLNDLGGAVSVALVRMGDALGLYKSLHQKGPMTVKELAAAAGGKRALFTGMGVPPRRLKLLVL